jgi:hypothetical protein
VAQALEFVVVPGLVAPGPESVRGLLLPVCSLLWVLRMSPLYVVLILME